MREEKYINYIDVFEDFYPVYDIENESKTYWKQFIPTEDFLELLNKFLTSLETNNPAEKKPIIVQGRYGTGKSHATGVIKHLLWDKYEDIEDFINKINDSQIRERIKKFRLKKRIFPVTIKGISTIFDHKSLVLTIEKAVKNSLAKESININIKSEFDKYIYAIENKKFIDWDKFIEDNPQIRALIFNKNNLLRELKAENIEILRAIEESFDFQIPVESIEDWLTDVSKKLKEIGISGMCIYWDEFTSIFELPQTSILLSVFQNIAEKTPYNDVYLFIITHRHPYQAQYSKEDYEKVLGRFKYQDYRMEEITTFHILGNIIKKKDINKWEEKKEEVYRDNKIATLIWELLKDPKQRESIKNVFPMHPYTAYIATKLAEYVGSTQRSIFNFYHDREKGFAKFIKDYPQEDSLGKHYFLTADFLWDFFYDDFLRSPDIKIKNIIEKSKYLNELKKYGKHYEVIYKGVLLLNLVSSFTTVERLGLEIYSPSVNNIKKMFLGTPYEKFVDEVLNYINNQGFITKTPDDLFYISLTPLPQREVDIEKDTFRKEYSNNILKAFNKEDEEKVKRIFQDNVLRPIEICLIEANAKDYEIKKKLKYEFRENYSLHIAVFLPRVESDIKEALNTIEKLLEEEDLFRNIVFVICHEALGERNFNELIEYKARAVVSDRHDFKEERELNLNYAKEIINKWIGKIEKSNGRLIYLNKSEIIYIRNFSDEINEKVSRNLFKFGPENIKELCNNINIWKKSVAEKPAEIFLYAENLRNLEDSAKNQPYKSLLPLLKTNSGEYIVDSNLKIKEGIDPDHPTLKIYREIEKKIKEREGQSFNLAETFSFIENPPFGLFPSMIGSALIAFLLRSFVDRLYEERTGIRIDKVKMKEKVVSLMKYINGEEKEREKLYVRLGTIEERELGEILRELFGLENNKGLNQIRWEVRNWIKTKGKYPIWSIKYLEDIKDIEMVNKFIKSIRTLIILPDSELKQEIIKTINTLLKHYKTDLKILLKPEKLENGFKNWVKKKIGVEISDEEMKELMNYLYGNIQEEVGLWDEDKVEAKLADWKINRMKKLVERDFINTLSNIFNLEGITSISELENKITEKINKDIRYPIWIFNYLFSSESIRQVLKDIEEFLKIGSKISENTMKDMTERLKSLENVLIKNLNSDTGRYSLRIYLESKGVKDTDKCMVFINENIKKEPFLWEESDLNEHVLKYQFMSYLAQVFKINVENKLDDFRNNLKNWMHSLDYPFWSFSSKENPLSNELINDIIEYVGSSYNLSIDFYEKICNTLNNYKDNIENLLDEKVAKNNLKTIIKDITYSKDEDLEDTIFKEILDDIRINMETSDFHLNKQAVENYIHRNVKKYLSKINEKKKERIKNKIKTTNKDLRDLLIKLIDEDPSICSFIERMLD
ncbi:MAG: hypothetical protein QXY96_06965 [Candidatus Methanomethylicaceae archaeon]